MYLLKIGPVAALVLSGVALFLLALLAYWFVAIRLRPLLDDACLGFCRGSRRHPLRPDSRARLVAVASARSRHAVHCPRARRSPRLCACAVLVHAHHRSTHSRHHHRHPERLAQLLWTRQLPPAARSREHSVSAASRVSAAMLMRCQIAALPMVVRTRSGSRPPRIA